MWYALYIYTATFLIQQEMHAVVCTFCVLDFDRILCPSKSFSPSFYFDLTILLNVSNQKASLINVMKPVKFVSPLKEYFRPRLPVTERSS